LIQGASNQARRSNYTAPNHNKAHCIGTVSEVIKYLIARPIGHYPYMYKSFPHDPSPHPIPASFRVGFEFGMLDLGGGLGSNNGLSLSDWLDLTLLAVLPNSQSIAFSPYLQSPSHYLEWRGQRGGKLTVHLANLNSISPRFSAANLLSSLRDLRTTRAETAK